jgi:hypothetical protein
MKYMLLIYDNESTRAAFFGDDGDALMAEIGAVMKEITESGELVSTEALADPSQSKTVRPRDGVVGSIPVATDGPYAESKEHLGGYLLVECETPERALEIATRWPNSRYGAMEVRPLLSMSGAEM